MKPQAKPQSKIPTTGINTNQKKKDGDPAAGDTSLLKKNEFTLIIAGALVATVLVFFLFFRDSGPVHQSVKGAMPAGEKVDKAMEKRVAELEVALARLASSPTADELGAGASKTSAKGGAELEDRLERLETAMTLKVDALIGRLSKVEATVSALKKAAEKPAPVVATTESKPPEKKVAVPQKTTQKTTPKSMFHTVQKGETLWSISQKYKTTVTAIRKLNKMSPEDNIYPGTNILVR